MGFALGQEGDFPGTDAENFAIAVKFHPAFEQVVQRGLRTPTGPFFARFSIRIIRGRADKCACTRRSTSLMTFFS
ncbi:MAG: hypothetical protein WCB94_19510, partial [Terriglobales bacterium]